MNLKILSGGQTGVDRAALDLALEQGISYGGWCPQGGWAEDAPNPPGVMQAYPELKETPSEEPAQRTEWNVRDADAVLILVDGGGIGVSEGTVLAEKQAAQYQKPLMVLEMDDATERERAGEWLGELITLHDVDQHFCLAVGGPRESEAPGIYAKAKAVLAGLIAET